MVTFFHVNFVFFKVVLTPGLHSNLTVPLVFISGKSQKYMQSVAWKLKRQMQEIKGMNGCFNLTFYIWDY